MVDVTSPDYIQPPAQATHQSAAEYAQLKHGLERDLDSTGLIQSEEKGGEGQNIELEGDIRVKQSDLPLLVCNLALLYLALHT